MSRHDGDPRHNHPTLTWDRMSAWQKKQYGVKPGHREDWASTAPGRTKYHHYGPDGQSKCNYGKGRGGPLFFHPHPEQLDPADCCSSCDLAILKAQQPARPEALSTPVPPPKPASQQLTLF